MQKSISPAMIASRIVSHGMVNGNVKEGKFSLGGTPFTIYLRPHHLSYSGRNREKRLLHSGWRKKTC